MRLLEITQGGTMAVDRAAGVIRGVKILGRESLNGRTYSPQAIRGAVGMYEGKQVNFDHRRSDPQGERSIADRAGWLTNVCEDACGGLSGDLHLLKEDARSGKVFEAAERRPQLFGLSHNAHGDVVSRGGKPVVERLLAVRSVDIVSDPATTKSLFESISLKEYEMNSDLVPTERPVEAPPVEAPPVEAVKVSFAQAMIAVLQDDGLDKAGKLSKLRALLAAEETAVAELQGSKEETPAAETPAAETSQQTPESVAELRRQVRQLKGRETARGLLESHGIGQQEARVAALSRCVNEPERQSLLATWPKDAGRTRRTEKPRSGAPLTEQRQGNLPANAKQFASAITL